MKVKGLTESKFYDLWYGLIIVNVNFPLCNAEVIK